MFKLKKIFDNLSNKNRRNNSDEYLIQQRLAKILCLGRLNLTLDNLDVCAYIKFLFMQWKPLRELKVQVNEIDCLNTSRNSPAKPLGCI
jgi:hypothetical protein